MFTADALTFREFAMAEELPLATLHTAVLEFLQGTGRRHSFGAQAVNAYVDEPRMTQDVDLLSSRAAELAEELRTYLHQRFHIALRVRRVAGGRGYPLLQVRKSGNPRLVDIHQVDSLPG